MTNNDRDPLVGPVGCGVLAAALIACGSLQLLIAMTITHGGDGAEVVTVLVALAGIVSAVTALAVLPRLVWAYRALWNSAAFLAAWFVITYVLSLGE